MAGPDIIVTMRRQATWIIGGLALGVLATLAVTRWWPADAPKTEINVGNARFVFPLIPAEDLPNAIRFAPIGYFHTPFTPDTGAPRQAGLSTETECEIRIDAPYRSGLKDLEKFEYIIVLYYFDLTRTWSPSISPPESGHRFGLFATRSPKRPNPIGLSVIRITKVDIPTGVITLAGGDAFDGTPVLDIKPYLPSVDRVESVQNTKTEKELGHHDEATIKDPTLYR